jgi:hypothetical protein
MERVPVRPYFSGVYVHDTVFSSHDEKTSIEYNKAIMTHMGPSRWRGWTRRQVLRLRCGGALVAFLFRAGASALHTFVVDTSVSFCSLAMSFKGSFSAIVE